MNPLIGAEQYTEICTSIETTVQRYAWHISFDHTFCVCYTVRKINNLQTILVLSNKLKGVFAKNERGYRLNAIKKRF